MELGYKTKNFSHVWPFYRKMFVSPINFFHQLSLIGQLTAKPNTAGEGRRGKRWEGIEGGRGLIYLSLYYVFMYLCLYALLELSNKFELRLWMCSDDRSMEESSLTFHTVRKLWQTVSVKPTNRRTGGVIEQFSSNMCTKKSEYIPSLSIWMAACTEKSIYLLFWCSYAVYENIIQTIEKVCGERIKKNLNSVVKILLIK